MYGCYKQYDPLSSFQYNLSLSLLPHPLAHPHSPPHPPSIVGLISFQDILFRLYNYIHHGSIFNISTTP